MIDDDFDTLAQTFFECAEDYLAAPDFAKGMTLHDLAARLGVACNAKRKDAGELVGVFHEFKRAIPGGDRDRLGELLQRIRLAIGQ